MVKRLAAAPLLLSFGWLTLTKLMDRLASIFDRTWILLSFRGEAAVRGGTKRSEAAAESGDPSAGPAGFEL